MRATLPGLAVGTLVAAGVVGVAAGPPDGAVMFAVAIAVILAVGLGLARVLGGVTGDSYGAVNKLVELSTYGCAAALYL
ncbi:adenosylcobinamide-GDP ribazoletransferase [Svornostia abyssi]|uniref:Adenosylcobinamide-GDP ribazoletransferase n=1 Tax=Svornostia abyssi TaxID=2898438 RepID=A0ABY5PBE0_9ACTN|nr:adenosylcobinamide-GDP ribazoletransferase [Parviterribacteraceae bacterium J379]